MTPIIAASSIGLVLRILPMGWLDSGTIPAVPAARSVVKMVALSGHWAYIE